MLDPCTGVGTTEAPERRSLTRVMPDEPMDPRPLPSETEASPLPLPDAPVRVNVDWFALVAPREYLVWLPDANGRVGFAEISLADILGLLADLGDKEDFLNFLFFVTVSSSSDEFDSLEL